MDVCFEISDRYYEELGSWSLQVGDAARAQLYAFRDHSPAQHGGRLLLPDIALAPPDAALTLHRSAPLVTAFSGLIGALHVRRVHGPERRDEVTIRLECGASICVMLEVRRWDNVDIAPALPVQGLEAWRMARPPRVADRLSGVLELQEIAFEAAGISSFPLLDEQAPDYPVSGTVTRLERLDLDPTSPDFGHIVPVEKLPDDLYWPHRYFVTLGT